MRSGRFESEWDATGKQVFRLRWDAPPALSPPILDPREASRREFVRYLIRSGRLSEDLG